ncbi:sodium:glutamate symporter [Stieleria sp. JC731]|uniref:sodium/glutamate symporter n=1 Tax=Pirellulaceae TaxID=2691357 RepID=UPI001E2D6744|nr:sodium/glutamate symporter [Stieleria sp. JC731]MCC9599828.1 sodium:glutamate symporter [Stieleria sp. JC731]
MIVSVVFVAFLLLLGVVLRQLIKPLRWLFIPGSVIAGFIGLFLVQLVLRTGAVDGPALAWIQQQTQILSSWPGPLVAFVFAAMMLQSPDTSGGPIDQSTSSRVARQGLMVWIIVLGETFVGLLATAAVIQPMMQVPNSFGMLIEAGFAGGHGTAGAMGVVFASDAVGLAAGLDLGMLMATCGLVYGVISGIVWINLGSRRGWFKKRSDGQNVAEDQKTDPQRAQQRTAIGYQVMPAEAIDPLLLQAVWIAIAVGLGMAAQFCVQQAADWMDFRFGWGAHAGAEGAQAELSQRMSASTLLGFPLFIYTMLAGLVLRKLMCRFGAGNLLDNITLQRLSATAMEVLVVAAIASLRIETLVSYAGAFSVLFIFGAIWTAVCLMVISRWVLPRENWFPLGLINYGMSTGTTATGFVLLRVVDPDLKTTAANDYALAVPISAPFVGGGILTIALPLLVLERVSIWWPTLAIGLVLLGLIMLGRRWNRLSERNVVAAE